MKSLQLTLTLAAALIGATAGAHAQVYKWVDHNGVTNYAGKPPADRQAVKNWDVVEEKISVYVEDPAVLRSLATASAAKRDPFLYDRIDRLERQLAAERQARHDALMAQAAASQAAYEECLAQRRVDCDGYGGASPYVAPVQIQPRRKPFRPGLALHGVTAGNVTTAIRNARGSFEVVPGRPATGAARPAARISQALPRR